MRATSSRPRVSFVMAMYNAAPTVGETVRSVLAQTLDDWELVAIDDASQDNTVAVVEAFADPRIRVIRQPENAGQVAALNRGLEEAQADLIARIDADDLCLANRLSRQVEWMVRHPHVAVLGTRAVIFDDSGRDRGVVASVRNRGAQLRTCLVRNRIANHVSVAARREVLVEFGGYNPALPVLADYHLWTRLVLSGRVITSLDDVLVRILRARATFSATTAAGARLSKEYATFYQLLSREFGATLTRDDAELMGQVVAGAPDQLSDDAIMHGTAVLARFHSDLLKGRATGAERRVAMRAAGDVFWEHVVRRILFGDKQGALRLVLRGCWRRESSPLTCVSSLAWWLRLGKAGRSAWAPPVPGGSALEVGNPS